LVVATALVEFSDNAVVRAVGSNDPQAGVFGRADSSDFSYSDIREIETTFFDPDVCF
jgi:hypothetical protein